MSSGQKPGRCLSSRGSVTRGTSANNRRLLASGNWWLPPCCCCFAFVRRLPVQSLPTLHPKSLALLFPLPPCLDPGVLLPPIVGNALLPAVPSPLQKLDGHPGAHRQGLRTQMK